MSEKQYRQALEQARWSLKAGRGLALDAEDRDLDAEFARVIAIIDQTLGVWEALESIPGFNQDLRTAEHELAEGRGVRYEVRRGALRRVQPATP